MSKHQYKEDPFNLAPLWDGILEIYEVYRKICEEHHLRHYVIGGTLLGAVRHKGFIPWDDDFDVGMPRPDYEKFKKIIVGELPTHLKFVNWENSDLSICCGKIQDSREAVVLEVEKALGRMLSNGIYVDVFPIDGCPPRGLAQKVQKFRLRFLAALERFHCHPFAQQTRKGRVGWIGGLFLSVLCPQLRTHKAIMGAYERILSEAEFSDDSQALLSGQGLNVLITYPAGTWNGSDEVPFADQFVVAPSAADALLSAQYGDYMKLPPKEAQHPSHEYAWRCSWWLGQTSE